MARSHRYHKSSKKRHKKCSFDGNNHTEGSRRGKGNRAQAEDRVLAITNKVREERELQAAQAEMEREKREKKKANLPIPKSESEELMAAAKAAEG